jgi:2',3'-cyclic-nucleotide 2'-phosphodiesterase (5'-nucleotidase family)
VIVRHADELRASGADWVVALVHDGVDWRCGPRGYAADPARYTELCRPWAGAVDAIVGTHTLGRWFGSIEGTPVVQPWPFGAELAVVELSSGEEPKTYAIAPEAGGRWTGAGREILEKAEASVLGDLPEPLYARSGGPSPLADFFARALREAAGSDAAAVDLVGRQPPADGVLCMLPAGRVSEADLLQLCPRREDSTVVGELGEEELRVLARTQWPEPWTAWGMDAVDPVVEGSSVLAVPEGDAAGHVERVLGRRVHWRPTGIGPRDSVREALRQHAAGTSSQG